METILTHALLVFEDRIAPGTLVVRDGRIHDVGEGRSQLPAAQDCGGDYIAPGLIDLHTDALEGHFVPRPKVIWPDPRAAALAHDGQTVASGITTVFDAICAGGFDQAKSVRRELFTVMLEAVEQGAPLFRADHHIHLRCELTDPSVLELVEPQLGRERLSLASLMDHTPGTRQWRNVEHLKTFLSGIGKSADEVEQEVLERTERGRAAVAENHSRLAALLRDTGIVLASHDDTVPAHVAMAQDAGCTISEFPTTMDAARAAHAAGLTTIGGAPNVVRGGSHSGGVAMKDLAAAGLLDALASDYVPASLLQGALALTRQGIALPQAMALVTARPARMAGLDDRGRLEAGLRADLLRFRLDGETPVVREVFVEGARVF
ncbi:MAG: phosphonate metabolism protein PhnM [Rhizobiales bacterium 24-66-13]|nr:MAG: phosphonate metabolism protein PhnM [Azorhizobium sp. 12-66-6]OYZ68980.1 MAG: phosphonate metabolism protein PhnM [Rhizobiales bacterium 24-66-13]OZB03085.1 MAG: phosphonate metabolism protein PhnM [Rhizobiales bacterium 39-66-18]HQS09929.1 alpha-D-ribose 1-methylphosphonate 5-triphosphate diphosphatase [Xanthobacteraceae bacterium]HQS48685.1 alpha-D-ribose 1-methylphosphonate 5-triphosphate diphosphatase [Xanthobacteraceae bacterium]